MQFSPPRKREVLEDFRVGWISSNAQYLLDHPGKSLGAQDRERLSAALDFLEKVSQGIEIATGQREYGFNGDNLALLAFEYAAESGQLVSQTNDLYDSKLFEAIEIYIEECLKRKRIIETEARKLALEFFSNLFERSLSSVSSFLGSK